jgi:hypothetical protein
MTKLAIALVAILVTLVSGCGGSVDHINYWADSTIPAETAEQACAAWTAGVRVECRRVDSDAANVLVTAFRDSSDIGGITDAWKTPITVKLNLNYTTDMATSIAHEFGHALGLGHLDTGPAIMNTWNDYDQPELTAVDMAGFRALYPAR